MVVSSRIVWSYPVVKDYVLYIGSNDGNLYAIYCTSSDVADSSWPVFQKDLKHTGK